MSASETVTRSPEREFVEQRVRAHQSLYTAEYERWAREAQAKGLTNPKVVKRVNAALATQGEKLWQRHLELLEEEVRAYVARADAPEPETEPEPESLRRLVSRKVIIRDDEDNITEIREYLE